MQTDSYIITAYLQNNTKMQMEFSAEFVMDVPPDYLEDRIYEELTHSIKKTLPDVEFDIKEATKYSATEVYNPIYGEAPFVSPYAMPYDTLGYKKTQVFQQEMASKYTAPYPALGPPPTNLASNATKQLKNLIPDIEKKVKCPVKSCKAEAPLFNSVMHLNDSHAWTPNAVADWMESLDLNLEFKEKKDNGQG
jgi:hypothetical protein